MKQNWLILMSRTLMVHTVDSGLDAQPYGLRPIGVELNQLKGWEN